jgi:hypothetical protein
MNPYLQVIGEQQQQLDLELFRNPPPHSQDSYIMSISPSSNLKDDDMGIGYDGDDIRSGDRAVTNKDEEGYISRLFFMALSKYGPNFTKLVKTVIPCVDEIKEHVNIESCVTRLLKDIDLELGYTKKEIYMMNEPIIEYIDTCYDRIQYNENTSGSPYRNENVKRILDNFYMNIQDIQDGTYSSI